MNATNRFVNRAILAVVGLVLLVAGTAGVLAVAWPTAGDIWASGLAAASDWMRTADESTRLSEGTTVSWFILGVLAALLLLVGIAVTVIARLGGGRASAVIRAEAEDGARGAVTIAPAFASDAIVHSLARREEILSSRVSSHRVRGRNVMHVSVTPRQNTSPLEVADAATQLIDNLAMLTGRDTPAYISVHTGIRARLASDRSRVS